MVDCKEIRELKQFDVLSITERSDATKKSRFYLEEKFKPSDKDGKAKVTAYLHNACTLGGCPSVVSCGSGGGQKLRLKCVRHRTYQKSTNTPSKQKYDDTNLYASNVRMNTLVNKNAHRRADGKSLPKRSEIKRPKSKEEQCKFMMALYVDTKLDRWYLKPGVGCRRHQHHAKPTQDEISQS